jgi:MFS superfamily sulfate permease-like transporter
MYYFRPRTTILGQYERSEIYKNAKRFTNVRNLLNKMYFLKIVCWFKVHEIPQIKIFRFESPIIYFNADYFRESLLDSVSGDLKSGQQESIHGKTSNEVYLNLRHLKHIIIDCSSINQLDYSGGKIFLQTIKELNDCQYRVYLCNLRCKKSIRRSKKKLFRLF